MSARRTSSKLDVVKDRAALGPVVAFREEVPPVRRVPVALARRFAQICMSVSAADVAPVGLTPLEYSVMAYLDQPGSKGDLDQTDLARRIGIDRQSVTLLVDALEKRDLVARRVNPTDRRSRLVTFTSTGRSLFNQIVPITFANQMRILEVLAPPEREVLLDLLLRVIEGNRDLARPGAGRRKRGTKTTKLNASEGNSDD